jgi:hypothetical protein
VGYIVSADPEVYLTRTISGHILAFQQFAPEYGVRVFSVSLFVSILLRPAGEPNIVLTSIVVLAEQVPHNCGLALGAPPQLAIVFPNDSRLQAIGVQD